MGKMQRLKKRREKRIKKIPPFRLTASCHELSGKRQRASLALVQNNVPRALIRYFSLFSKPKSPVRRFPFLFAAASVATQGHETERKQLYYAR